MDSLQDWYSRASFCIAPDGSGEFPRDHYSAVTRWLLDPANGKWILVFDNANSELNFGEFLPKNVPWGKTLFTSCTEEIEMGTKLQNDQLVFVPMPPLSTEQALELFMLRCASPNLTQAQRLDVSKLCSSLRHNPFAVSLASIHFQSVQTTLELGTAGYDSSKNGDGYIQLLTSLLIEDARADQRMLLQFYVLLSRRTVSQDIVNLCQRSRRRHRDIQTATEFLGTSNTGSAVQHWVSVGLLQRQTSPSGPVFVIPSPVETVILQELADDPERKENILNLGFLLVGSAQDDTSLSFTKSIAKCMDKTVASFRNLCLFARDTSMLLPDDTGKYLQLAALHYLSKTIKQGRLLFPKLFWRQWLSSFQYPPPAYLSGNEESLSPVPIFRWPRWLETHLQSNENLENFDIKSIVHKALVSKLWHELKLAMLLAGMGRAWHGVRDHVFDYARYNFHSDFSANQKANFIDFIDKGGAEGLQAALQTITRSDEFEQEVTNRIDSDAVNDIVQIICAVSHPGILSLSEEAVQQAISKAVDVMHETFLEASSSMAEALIPLEGILKTVIQGPLEVPSDGEGARNMVSFIISSMGEQYIRERCLTMTEGFCECLDSSKIWIAANVCLHLAYAALDETESMPEDCWNWICSIIELVREGVMPVERVPGRVGEVAGRRMLYWLEEAYKCRSAWGAQPDTSVYSFRNQGQWEETFVLMGAISGSWILS